ncbi:nucleotidyltransferase [Rhodocytophaga rosea]|uniref:Nucleotidyltransferase n=1 Tax=Rhodocytophaga rosea TaxID=2704465 RepID=A0A6C0GDV4_9BACT|nr:nucleotidyltransferase domain-containing protein [Rhodocytophaga rosea]QHT65942.1 nucleotidyltransferase [Rhodocytophaga rosea]
MTIEQLKAQNLIIFECISGSKAYGTSLPTSDTDIRGVFVLPESDFYGMGYIEQVNDTNNDIVYYELKRFIELLYKNNPNILEMLNAPEDCVLIRHPLFEQIRPELFLSKLCKVTLAGYARAQVQKARGLNKKIVNPVAPERKEIIDFCYVTAGIGSQPAREWLAGKSWVQERCGLVNVPHIKNLYALFYDDTPAASFGFSGIYRNDSSNDVSLSSVPAGMEPATYLSFNKDGYSTYCKDYKDYWEWVENRNQERYANTLQHGKNYDAKNMMHTIRLLEMAEEIAVQKHILVRRPNRDELLKIRGGAYSYEELLALSEQKMERIEQAYEASGLPDHPDYQKINLLLADLRKKFYTRS